MPKIMDPVLAILSILGNRAIVLGSLGGLINWKSSCVGEQERHLLPAPLHGPDC